MTLVSVCPLLIPSRFIETNRHIALTSWFLYPIKKLEQKTCESKLPVSLSWQYVLHQSHSLLENHQVKTPHPLHPSMQNRWTKTKSKHLPSPCFCNSSPSLAPLLRGGALIHRIKKLNKGFNASTVWVFFEWVSVPIHDVFLRNTRNWRSQIWLLVKEEEYTSFQFC